MKPFNKTLNNKSFFNERCLPEYEHSARKNLELNSALKQASHRKTANPASDVFFSIELANQVRKSWWQSAALNKQEVIKSKFQNLIAQWRKDTVFLSSSTDKLSHPAYLKIIGMGEPALPLIFREMKERGGHWFLALRSISDADPVNPEDVGKIKKMTEAWLQWGMQNGYL